MQKQLRDSWRSRLDRHYNLPKGELVCTVLKELFPESLKAQAVWARRKGWGSAFPAVGEHIIPASQQSVGQAHNLDTENGYNGLPLLRHIEKMFSSGQLSIQPTGKYDETNGVELKVFACSCIRSESVCYMQRTVNSAESLPKDPTVKQQETKGSRREPIIFNDLHAKTFVMTISPSMRCLYLKAQMAFAVGTEGACKTCKNRGIPNPDDAANFERFAVKCPKMRDILGGALLHVSPTAAEMKAYAAPVPLEERTRQPGQKRKRQEEAC
eukprot:332101-Amphidinium_carterae.1